MARIGVAQAPHERRKSGEKPKVRAKGILATLATTLALIVLPALGGQALAAPPLAAEQGYSDPLEPVNERLLTFNLDLDRYVVSPVARFYLAVVPVPARRAVGHFLDNTNIVPRLMNNLFQLRFKEAGTELGRFVINSTVGVAGFFDVADSWFGLKEYNDDFGLTLGRYGVGAGPYLMLPFFGPSTVRDTAGLIVDGVMNPLDWLTPWYVWLPADSGYYAIGAVNYRSLHPDQFENADRYAVDLYGAVQDVYMQTRRHQLSQIKESNW